MRPRDAAFGAYRETSPEARAKIQAAVADCGLPEGVFSLLYGAGSSLGTALVSDPRIKTVGFTASRAGGLSLMHVAQTRALSGSRRSCCRNRCATRTRGACRGLKSRMPA